MADPGDAASEGAASGGAGHEDGCQETADPEDLVRRADALLWASRMVWDLGGSARHLVARLAGESRAVMAYCA
ncbi:MAG: hypothetical protein LBK95_03155, partial [Bifidobacteriaceae bacterium]|nr:hypothetical protein [Bifidobacteriaceae bacterium]